MNRTLCSTLIITLLAGCATTVPMQSTGRPTMVDPKYTDMARYEADFGDCARLANETDAANTAAANAAARGVAGAIVGGILGAIVGAAFGDAGSGARYGAALGGVEGVAVGGSQGYVAGRIDQETALRNCLTGRGYRLIR